MDVLEPVAQQKRHELIGEYYADFMLSPATIIALPHFGSETKENDGTSTAADGIPYVATDFSLKCQVVTGDFSST